MIKVALKEAGLKSAVITSTIRTPEIQADAMYTNCKKKGGLAYQKEHVYKNPKSPARAVLKVFEENSLKPEAEVVKLMVEKIVELGKEPKPRRVSDHCVTKEAYAIKNVIDLRIPALQADNDKFVSALEKLMAEGYIHFVLPEPKNGCIHVEIIVNGKDLQKYEANTILKTVVYC